MEWHNVKWFSLNSIELNHPKKYYTKEQSMQV